jgi:hypothetical protein
VSERCPLSGGALAIESLPDICKKSCALLWEAAIKNYVEVDYYPEKPESNGDCSHELFEVVHSHEALQAVDDSSLRFYSTVDSCEGCETELFENIYRFDCPNN